MGNPFRQLGKQQTLESRGEEVGGAFSCEECHNVVHVARYMDDVSILSWKCDKCEHISKIEGFHID